VKKYVLKKYSESTRELQKCSKIVTSTQECKFVAYVWALEERVTCTGDRFDYGVECPASWRERKG